MKTLIEVVPNILVSVKIKSAARMQGWQVVAARDENAFMEAIRAGATLVVIDANSISLFWMDWVRTIKSNPELAKIPIMAFGGHVDVARKREAMEAGVDRYFVNSEFMSVLPELLA